MSERYDRDEFRTWLTSYEGHEQPFNSFDCPLVIWRREAFHEDVRNGEVPFRAEWCRSLVAEVDARTERMNASWADLTVKDVLTIVDKLEFA